MGVVLEVEGSEFKSWYMTGKLEITFRREINDCVCVCVCVCVRACEREWGREGVRW